MTIDYTQPRPPQRPQSPDHPPGGWFARNWKWVVIFGCLTPILLAGGCVAAVVFIAFGAIRATDVYDNAILRAQNDPRVIEHLGAPVKAGWWVTGNVSINNDQGTADFVLPLNGSKKRGKLEVEASRDGGPWNYSVLRVRVDDGPVIDLAPPLHPSPSESPSTAPPGD